jgi:hypothetical protein
MSIAEGDFSFIASEIQRAMLEDAYRVCNSVEGCWEYLARQDVPPPGEGFIYTRDPFLMKIGNLVDADGKIGHSALTYGFTMRQMEFIAKNGWEAFVSLKLNTSLPSQPLLKQQILATQ